MIVLGIDPGPSSSGWAVLRAGQGTRRPAFVEGGTFDSTSAAVAQLLATWITRSGHEVLVLAIEIVEGYAHDHFRTKSLHATADVQGLIRGVAESGMSLPVQRIPAREWRAALCGRTSPNDPEIKRALEVLVEAFPRRSNKHVRDAMGAAFGVIQRRWLSAWSPQIVKRDWGF